MKSGKRRGPAQQQQSSKAKLVARETAKPSTEDQTTFWIICGILVVVTLGLYAPTKGFDFVDFDDYEYVKINPFVEQGLASKSVAWAFTGTQVGN